MSRRITKDEALEALDDLDRSRITDSLLAAKSYDILKAYIKQTRKEGKTIPQITLRKTPI